MKLISVVTACFNEEENVEKLVGTVKEIFARYPQYEYEHLFIDNSSKDKTVPILRKIASTDRHVKVIVNARNFGHIRSPFHGLINAQGDAVISLVADFQDPPNLIEEFLKKWEEGYKIVVAIKNESDEFAFFFFLRNIYYRLVTRLAEVELLKNFTGFGLYDRQVMDILKSIKDPYPYFRGLISEIGFEKARIPYRQPNRKRGISKNNFYSLFDMAMLGITTHSKIPLRLATMLGFLLSAISLFIAIAYLLLKLFAWSSLSIGLAPLIIGLFFFASVQLFFIGVLGEYIGSIHTQILNRPRVIEKERINF